MRIPYVIDNQAAVLADVLQDLLACHKGQSLDVATAYFTIQSFRLIGEGLQGLGSLRLLIGSEPASGRDVGLPIRQALRAALRADLEGEPFDEATLRLVEDLIAFLRREGVAVQLHCGEAGFLHAKCFLFYSDRPGPQMLFERFRPIVGIVGSSNLTGPGLTSNRELNLAHKAILDPEEAEDGEARRSVAWLSEDRPSEPMAARARQLIKSEVGARAIIELERWFESRWRVGRDFKEELVELLDASKFGQKEYTPYDVYTKALFEYFRADLDAAAPPGVRSAVDLAEFQEDAVKKARRILARYDGVMIADSVGLGKTWIGKKLLEDFAYHLRQKALVVCPASLREMWERELAETSIAARVLSQEELGREQCDIEPYGDADVILIDESHNFRNLRAQRYLSLERLVNLNGGWGAQGGRKKLILLTATPINNDLMDLYHQINLVARGDRSYFAAAGIGDLPRYFQAACRASRQGDGVVALFNLLEEIVIRRTRAFIKRAYPDATIAGKRITFPERRLKTETYDLEATYEGIYENIVQRIEALNLAPYNLASYKKKLVPEEKFDRGREQALVGIFKSRYLKRLESSLEALRISVRRALEFQKTFLSYLLDGKLLASTDFQKILRYVESEGEEDDATPGSRADDIETSEEARALVAELATVNPADYDLKRLHEAVQKDVDSLTEIWHQIREIPHARDAKLSLLKELLVRLKGKKLIIFSYYRDTVRYLHRELTTGVGREAKLERLLGKVQIRRMDSGVETKERGRIVQAFAPRANGKPEIAGTDREIDILLTTDVLSEGQNLQDCAHLINYDLHWNPTRMVQRAGRIDRIGTPFDTLYVHNVFPEEGLEKLLKLVESLSLKIADIDRTGFLDTSVLGEVVHPRNFNTLRRIRDEDGSVFDEEEEFTELASPEGLVQELRQLLDAGGLSVLQELPDGIHSGMARPGARGMFFYFQARPTGGDVQHFWRYLDLLDDRIIDNRLVIANLIRCPPNSPRAPDAHDVFKAQERVIADILKGVEEQVGLEAVPKLLDPIQQTIAAILQGYLSSPKVDRATLVRVLRFLARPAPGVVVRDLKRAHSGFAPGEPLLFVDAVLEVMARYSPREQAKADRRPSLRREDLRLICFEHIVD